jgi:methionyl-tRNA formyltransferase
MPELRDCKIVFLGTPEFAVAILDKLYRESCQIVGVVTAPDKPAGRGMQLTQSAVKQYALEKGLPVLQPVKLKDPDFLEALKSLDADIQVVVAFRMLPEVVWNMPPLGTINLHASLLPQYRGAAPINWAIINGEHETGITTFTLQHAIDTGDVLMQERISVRDDETAGELHDTMKARGADLVYATLVQYCAGTLQGKPQQDVDASIAYPLAPKIHTADCKIDWSRSAREVFNLIRGLSPYPGAFTYLDGKMLKVFRSTLEAVGEQVVVGTHDTDGKSYLRFAASDGWVYLQEIQLEGKKRMNIADFLRGHRFNAVI